jgi:hypothetical protein
MAALLSTAALAAFALALAVAVLAGTVLVVLVVRAIGGRRSSAISSPIRGFTSRCRNSSTT